MPFIQKLWKPFRSGGTAVGSADLNRMEKGIADAFAGLADIRVRAHNNAQQGVAGSGANPSIMSFNAVDYDTDGMHPLPAGGSRFTAVHAGMYVIFAMLLPQQQPPGNYQMHLRANGNSTIAYQPNGITSQIWEGSVMGLRYLAVNEYFEFLVNNFNAGGFQTNVDLVAARIPVAV
jgi:hypothetical protein